jgi:hypothetical protein
VGREPAEIEARDDLVDRLQPLVDERDWAGVEAVVGPVAQDAAAGSNDALELLLYLVDRCRLSYGPIWSVLSDPIAVEDAAQETVVAVRCEPSNPDLVLLVARRATPSWTHARRRQAAPPSASQGG